MGISQVTDLTIPEMHFITSMMKDICSGIRNIKISTEEVESLLELSQTPSSKRYESICDSLLKIMNSQIWVGSRYSPLLDEWKADKEWVYLTINSDVINNLNYSVDYITKILCNPNKQSFLVEGVEI